MNASPLPSEIRPESLKDYFGQEHLVGDNMPIRIAIEKKHLFSFILWGPPGTGKTTLARIYAKSLDAELYELSAVSAGKDDIRAIVEDNVRLIAKPKVLFLDEIHRFNKAQQDFLLPYVESGAITLIGATTENPSFEIIPALLSRARVFILESLDEDSIKKILIRAVGEKPHKKSSSKSKIPKAALDWLVSFANGDARQALGLLDTVLRLYGKVTVPLLEDSLQSKFIRYDKKGEEHYNTISAFIKSMRASQPDAALYYLARMIDAGEDPKFIARRMVIFASEDIGMEVPTALVVANEVFRAVEIIGLPEAQINLAHGVTYLSLCKKSKASYEAYFEALADVKAHGNLPIPLKIRNAPTKLMKDIGYGKGYERYTKEDLLPEKLKGKTYYKRKTTQEKGDEK
jgi:putative ATPase